MEQKRELPKQQNQLYQLYEEQEAKLVVPEPDPMKLAMLMRWKKVKDKDGKIKRVYRIINTN